jgi:ABC-type sulfate/molybdate transport systems ATPase subunit
MTVLENVGYGARGPSREFVAELIEALGISEFEGRRPGELSGGQRARVALARALARDPKAVLLDEPLSSLDTLARREVLELMTKVVGGLGVPSILVTHDLFEAQRFGDRLGLLDRGRILQLGDPSEVVSRPVTRRAAELVGYREFLEVPSARSGSGARYVIGVHPSRVVLVSVENASLLRSPVNALQEGSFVFEGTIVGRWPEGAGCGVSVRLDSIQGGEMTFSVPFAKTDIREGSRCRFALLDPPIFDCAGMACQSGSIRAELSSELWVSAGHDRGSYVQ